MPNVEVVYIYNYFFFFFCMCLLYFTIFSLKVHITNSPNVFRSAFLQSDADYDDGGLINKMAVN